MCVLVASRALLMAPKPASAAKPTSAGKKPTAAGKKSPDGKQTMVAATGAPASEDGTTLAPPQSKEEVLAQVSFEGLPPAPQEQILDILGGKYDRLVKIFAHYCKFSECKTMEMATRCKLGEPRSCVHPRAPRDARDAGRMAVHWRSRSTGAPGRTTASGCTSWRSGSAMRLRLARLAPRAWLASCVLRPRTDERS